VPSPSPSPQTLLDSLLSVAGIFVQPDWDAIRSLFPVLLLVLFVVWFALTMRRYATLGPRRRAPARVEPITPPHVHMPGGSAAPILAALGAAALFFGLGFLTVPGAEVLLIVGVALLILTLLVWFREGMRDYAHLEPAAAPADRHLPAVVHEGPPPGVHMPGPSIRPLMGALGSAALLGALAFGGWLLVVAVVFLVYTLIGWLVDFTAEYRKVEEADHTGHLENIPARALPTRSLQVFGVLFVVVALWQAGIFPPPSAGAGNGPGASPGASGQTPAGSGGPGGGGGGDLVVVAKSIAYDVTQLQAPAGEPFTITFKNEDPATTTHDIDIHGPDGAVLQDQQPIAGGTEQAYEYTALEPGEYQFICSVHPIPQMTGTLTVQ
jgi:plastocyanin